MPISFDKSLSNAALVHVLYMYRYFLLLAYFLCFFFIFKAIINNSLPYFQLKTEISIQDLWFGACWSLEIRIERVPV